MIRMISKYNVIITLILFVWLVACLSCKLHQDGKYQYECETCRSSTVHVAINLFLLMRNIYK